MTPQDEDRGELSLPYSILSIDLGETTGSAWYVPRTNKLSCGSTKDPAEIITFVNFIAPQLVILESFPATRSLAQGLESVYESLLEISIPVSPGTWKPFMKSRKKKFAEAKNQHEKDALNILRYYFITKYGRDIE